MGKHRKVHAVCYYCRTQLTVAIATSDHRLPLWKGGTSQNGNKVPCCWDCNQLKGAMDEETFMRVRDDPVALRRERYLAQRHSWEALGKRCDAEMKRPLRR